MRERLFALLCFGVFSTSFADQVSVCRNAVRDLQAVRRVSVLVDCLDFYWHSGDPEDTVHGYDRMLQIGERLVVLEPAQLTTYGDLAWLYWSRWKETVKEPESLPQRLDYLGKLRQLLNRALGVPSLQREFLFLSDTGFTIYMMQKDLLDLLPMMQSLFERALVVANLNDPEQKQTSVNVAKQLGYHHLNQFGNKRRALDYFNYALELQPSNAGARRMKERLEREIAEEG
jgi:hypothetical protein